MLLGDQLLLSLLIISRGCAATACSMDPLGMLVEMPIGGEGLGALGAREVGAIGTVTAGDLQEKDIG